LISHSFDIGTFPSSGGALQALLASGRLTLIRSDSLSALLAEWPTLRDNIASNAELLVLNREAGIQDYLVQAGVPISRIASTLDWLDRPRNKFDFDPITLLSSVTLESVFATRAVRSGFLEDAYRTARAHVSETIRLLRAGLD